MSILRVSNFAETVLSEAISMADTELFVRPEDISRFPVLGASETFRVILWDGVNTPEICDVTVVDLDGTFTVTRGAEDTTAREWPANTQVRHAITAGTYEYLQGIVEGLVATSETLVEIGLNEKIFITQENKLFLPGQYVIITSDADPLNKWMLGQVLSYVGTSLSVNVTQINDDGEADDWTIMVSGPAGPVGTAGDDGAAGAAGEDGEDGLPGANGRTVRNGFGAPGTGIGVNGDFYIDKTATAIYGPKSDDGWGNATSLIGATGEDGTTPGIRYNFSSSVVEEDPGNGIFRFDSAIFGSITEMYISDIDQGGIDQSGFILNWDSPANNIKGYLFIYEIANPVNVTILAINDVDDATGYLVVHITPLSGEVPDSGLEMVISFARSGDAGDTFLNLGDTPADYTDDAGKSIIVNDAETGLEFNFMEKTIVNINSLADNYTITEDDNKGLIEIDAATTKTVLIPTDVAEPNLPAAGGGVPMAVVEVIRLGNGLVVIEADTGVLLNGQDGGTIELTIKYQSATLYKRDANEWICPNYEVV